MKFYDELYSSELEHYEIPGGAWTPIYLKEPDEPDPPLRAVLSLLGIKSISAGSVLLAQPGDFIKKYIEIYDREKQVRLIIFIDGRQYFLSYMTPPGKYLFGNSEVDIMIFGDEMIIGRHLDPNSLGQAVADFAELGFSEVRLRLGQKHSYV
jgi:hypothetical protein